MEQQPSQTLQEIDTLLSYRTGWPTLPTLPVKTVDRDNNLPREWDKPLVDQILSENGIRVLEQSLCYRFNNGVPIPERRPTVLVWSDLRFEGQNIDKWRQAVHDISKMFQKQPSMNGFTIEIVDHRVNRIKTDIIYSHEKEVLDAWTELAPRITECLFDAGHKWTSIDLLHRRLMDAEEGAKATIVISAADANENIWRLETLPRLRSFLPDFLQVELVYLDSILAMDSSEGPKHDYEQEYADIREDVRQHQDSIDGIYLNPRVIPMGAPCGRKWKGDEPGPGQLAQGGGTLGGLVKLDGLDNHFGLSNRHVFNREDEVPEPIHLNNVPVIVPSNGDKNRMLGNLSRRKSLLLKKEEDGTLRPNEKLEFDHLQDAFRRYDDDVGTIYTSSGTESIVNKRMEDEFCGTWESDWCLIQLDNKKTLRDKTPFQPLAKVTTYQRISPFEHYDVQKFGKTTGTTIGTVSAAISWHRKEGEKLGQLPDPSKRPSVAIYGRSGSPVKRKRDLEDTRPSNQTRICHTIRSRRASQNFMEKGDSGCFILLDAAAGEVTEKAISAPVIGLGFAKNEVTTTAYMMPFDLVVEDIKNVTGKKVVQPRLDGDAQPRKVDTIAA